MLHGLGEPFTVWCQNTDVKYYICLAPAYLGVSAFTNAFKGDNTLEHIHDYNSLISLLFGKITVDAKAVLKKIIFFLGEFDEVW